MTEQWKWASQKRIKEAAEELKAIILARYPDAQFRLSRAHDDRDAWHLWTLVDIEDPDEVGDLTKDREIDMLVEEHIPLHVIPTLSRERFTDDLPERVRRTGSGGQSVSQIRPQSCRASDGQANPWRTANADAAARLSAPILPYALVR